MKYYVENADYTQNKPVLYSEKTLIEYAMKLYTEYSEQGQYDWLLEKYPEKNTPVEISSDLISNAMSGSGYTKSEIENDYEVGGALSGYKKLGNTNYFYREM